MELMQRLFSNYLLNLCVLAWCCAQLIKFLINLVSHHNVKLERLYGSGGMPSSHTATVCALTMGVAQVCGYSSAEFAIAAALSAIVIYDAMGVRRAAGEHAKILNQMMDEYEKNDELGEDGLPERKKDLKELLGHTPMEVLGGALLGILISMIYQYGG